MYFIHAGKVLKWGIKGVVAPEGVEHIKRNLYVNVGLLIKISSIEMHARGTKKLFSIFKK